MDNHSKSEVLGKLTDKRLRHTQGVRETAGKLCRIHFKGTVEELQDFIERTDTAVCCHDLFRGRSAEELNKLVAELGLDERYMDSPNLSHGKIAALVMERDYGITDQDMLNAVSFHTTGRRGMSLMEKIVFLADAIEPGREYPGVDEIREISLTDLDRACLMSLEGTIGFLLESGKTAGEIDQDTLRARDWLAECLEKQ